MTQLPVDEIEVDTSFVRGMPIRSEDLAVVRSVAELGRGLRLDVVVEGVEEASSWLAQTWHAAACTGLAGRRGQ